MIMFRENCIKRNKMKNYSVEWLNLVETSKMLKKGQKLLKNDILGILCYISFLASLNMILFR